MQSKPVSLRLPHLASSALICWIALPCAARVDGGPEQALSRFATREMERLETVGPVVKRATISRYFAAYPLPTREREVQRLLGTAQRILVAFAGKLQTAARERVRKDGSSAIEQAHITAAVEKLLPGADSPYKTRIFFPRAPLGDQVEVELMDLRAFQDTPLPWRALAAPMRPAARLAFRDEVALGEFAAAVSSHGLLIFRLAGKFASEDFSPAVTSPHLRRAEKAIARRAGSAVTEAPTSTAPVPLQVRFVDVAGANGIRFRHVSSDWISRFRRYGPLAPTFSGGGVTAGDLDGDGWPDLVYCGGEGCAAFRNQHDATFEEVTAASRINVPGEARMSLVADFDNDGDQDLFITYARDTNRLFRNGGGGRFEDITPQSGLRTTEDISGPAIAFDHDNDGSLDVYVGNFGDYLNGATPWVSPDSQNAQSNRLYRNLGEMRFEDVTDGAAGNTGWTQALSHVDYNQDGYQDIYIANDFGSNELLENQGDGTFRARGEAGTTGDRFHGMSVAFADLNRDTYADIFISNIWGWVPTEREPGETNSLLISAARENGVRYRSDRSRIPGLIRRDTGWSWAALFFDADNDGDDDLFVANGLTDYSTARQVRPHPTRSGLLYPVSHNRERNLFFLHQDGLLEVPPEVSGAELGGCNSRAIALLDYDRDGDLDMALSTFHSSARLFRNDGAPRANHWLSVELVGDPARGVNRNAIGARLIARNADSGLYVWRAVTGGEGYMAMSTLPVGIGLGEARSVDLEIHWPGMERQVVEEIAAEQRIRIYQGNPVFESIDPR